MNCPEVGATLRLLTSPINQLIPCPNQSLLKNPQFPLPSKLARPTTGALAEKVPRNHSVTGPTREPDSHRLPTRLKKMARFTFAAANTAPMVRSVTDRTRVCNQAVS